MPKSNRYVATNTYGEQKFGFGNIMVGFVLKNCVGGNNVPQDTFNNAEVMAAIEKTED